ncbi:MAG: energy-coupling factor ABC transporter permease [Burkholderiaceae bacterium]
MWFELAFCAAALAVSLAMRPWRLMPHGERLGPLLGSLVLLPWVWMLPGPLPIASQIHWSGACLVVLMLGWPIAVPVLIGVAAASWLIAPTLSGAQAVALAFWQGVLPATLALGAGALLRRAFGERLFVYLFGRAFIATVLCVFVSGLLQAATGDAIPDVDFGSSLVARWLMAWGDGIVTGMLAAVFVAFMPQWLATWSDALYLHAGPDRRP